MAVVGTVEIVADGVSAQDVVSVAVAVLVGVVGEEAVVDDDLRLVVLLVFPASLLARGIVGVDVDLVQVAQLLVLPQCDLGHAEVFDLLEDEVAVGVANHFVPDGLVGLHVERLPVVLLLDEVSPVHAHVAHGGHGHLLREGAEVVRSGVEAVVGGKVEGFVGVHHHGRLAAVQFAQSAPSRAYGDGWEHAVVEGEGVAPVGCLGAQVQRYVAVEVVWQWEDGVEAVDFHVIVRMVFFLQHAVGPFLQQFFPRLVRIPPRKCQDVVLIEFRCDNLEPRPFRLLEQVHGLSRLCERCDDVHLLLERLDGGAVEVLQGIVAEPPGAGFGGEEVDGGVIGQILGRHEGVNPCRVAEVAVAEE